MIYEFKNIRHLHLEISSKCNAECPGCPRNLYGAEYNNGYKEHSMTLDEARKIFNEDFLRQIDRVLINGNFGDFVMNPDSLQILEYFKSINPRLYIEVNTNGGARNRDFWRSLARLPGLQINFTLDGIGETHSIYRRNTRYDTVIDNARSFIAAGGRAVWLMIEFDHNRHQIAEAERLSRELGFAWFKLRANDRQPGPVFDRQGKFQYVIGPYTGTRNYQEILAQKNIKNTIEGVERYSQYKDPIDCMVKRQQSIYVTSTGEVYPCCFLGFSPKTFGHGDYHQVSNEQIRELVQENDALTYGLEHAANWFYRVSETWNRDTFAQGRLIMCNDVCGKTAR